MIRFALPVLLITLLAPHQVRSTPSSDIDPAILGMPNTPWIFQHQGPRGPETYLIPNQLDKVKRLPEPARSDGLRIIRAQESRLAFLRATIGRAFPRLQSGALHATPEYTVDLAEVVMGIDAENAHDANPLSRHEAILLALPAYTRVVLLTPEAALPQVRRRLRVLDMSHRVRPVLSQKRTGSEPAAGVSHWVRDLMFVTHDGNTTTLLTSLAHKNWRDLAHNDLEYLNRTAGKDRHLLRMPIFFRGGNLLMAAREKQTLLLVGRDELAMNQDWIAKTFHFSPLPEAVPEILKAATGADAVLILPNSRHFFHLDTYLTPLADGQIGLLAPLDSERLPQADRDVLAQTRQLLLSKGFAIVDIPTTAHRISHYQSPVNIVPFVDRQSGQRRALTPMFPESPGDSLNAKVLAAYRRAGIDPIPVEDHFHERWGSIHCALVPLH